jgi:hypothetical protein
MTGPLRRRDRSPNTSTGRWVLGAGLTCRSQIAVASTHMAIRSTYGPELDKHSELDLIAVRTDGHRPGVGTALTSFLEERLPAASVQVRFENSPGCIDVERLRASYTRLGFTVGKAGGHRPPRPQRASTFTRCRGQGRASEATSETSRRDAPCSPRDPRKARPARAALDVEQRDSHAVPPARGNVVRPTVPRRGEAHGPFASGLGPGVHWRCRVTSTCRAPS